MNDHLIIRFRRKQEVKALFHLPCTHAVTGELLPLMPEPYWYPTVGAVFHLLSTIVRVPSPRPSGNLSFEVTQGGELLTVFAPVIWENKDHDLMLIHVVDRATGEREAADGVPIFSLSGVTALRHASDNIGQN